MDAPPMMLIAPAEEERRSVWMTEYQFPFRQHRPPEPVTAEVSEAMFEQNVSEQYPLMIFFQG